MTAAPQAAPSEARRDIEVITKSRLAAFATCQRLHDLTYNLGYRSIAPRELADFGSLFHAGLDAWWGAYIGSEPLPGIALSAALAGMAAYRAEQAPAIDDAAMAKAELLMTAYDARWSAEMENWEVLGVEVEFMVVLPGRKRLRVSGKLDKLLRKRVDGSVWFVEHKTTGADLSAGSTYWQKLRLDPQVSIYHMGVRQLGHEPAGCLYDVIDRPAQKPLLATPVELRKYTKATAKEPSRLYANQRDTDETLDEFQVRMAELIAKEPDAYFARAEVIRLEGEIEESLKDVTEMALQIRMGSLTGVSPRNPDACFKWGRPCDMYDACAGVASIDDETRFVRLENPHPELAGIAK
jgi:hypothetical protein